MTKTIQYLRQAYDDFLLGGSDYSFDQLAMEYFRYHRIYNKVYARWCDILQCGEPQCVEDIPFLPIQFFKSHRISLSDHHDVVFTSSGTSGQRVSRHHVHDIAIYNASFRAGWRRYYGEVAGTCILGLLPSYLEREGSSLIHMVDDMIRSSGVSDSDFYLDDMEALYDTLCRRKETGEPTVLIGVSFGLLDFVERYSLEFPELIVMETGGMKGRRKEITRSELHDILMDGFGVSSIHSEYGMTELLSQAYSRGQGLFDLSSTLKVVLREITDPLTVHSEKGRSGLINCIDLSNLYSCPFIATDDVGVLYEGGAFAVQGRMDYADVRGCNLMVR